jgi:hypothetical protein
MMFLSAVLRSPQQNMYYNTWRDTGNSPAMRGWTSDYWLGEIFVGAGWLLASRKKNWQRE